MLKSLPPWGKVLNEVKRMRGKCAAATRERVVLGSLALISQRAGPLTASPEGEASDFGPLCEGAESVVYPAKNAFCTAFSTAARPAVKFTPPCR